MNEKELNGMGRGKSFNHKKKGHESQPPKYATDNPELSVEAVNNSNQQNRQ